MDPKTTYKKWVKYNIAFEAREKLKYLVCTVLFLFFSNFIFNFFNPDLEIFLLEWTYFSSISLSLLAYINFKKNVLTAISSLVLVFSGCYLTLIYCYFFLNVTHNHEMVLFALCLTIPVGIWFNSKFTLEHLISSFLNLSFIVMAILLSPEDLKDDLVSPLGIWLIFTLPSAYFSLFHFKRSIASSFSAHLQSLPYEIAEVVSFSPNNLKASEIFPPKYRHTACVTIDWRGFSKFCSEHKNKAEFICTELSIFHEQVLKMLKISIPSGKFYRNWNADESFIVIYSDDENEVLESTHNFIDLFRKEFYQILVDSNASFIPRFDLGAAIGWDIVGYAGPSDHEKTTSFGDTGMRAKRREVMAKGLRIEHCKDSNNPTVVIDEKLFLAKRGDYKELNFTVKDIEEENCYVLLPDGIEISAKHILKSVS